MVKKQRGIDSAGNGMERKPTKRLQVEITPQTRWFPEQSGCVG